MAVSVGFVNNHVAVVEFGEPPNNFFDVDLLTTVADAYASLSANSLCRAIVLCSQGRHFCAGANFRKPGPSPIERDGSAKPHLYDVGIRLFEYDLPVVAATQGGVVGGGLGFALSADFRVATPETRFTANFARVGLHQGFGMTVTLPHAIGQQAALDMFYTGRDVFGEEALAMRLCDRLAPPDGLRDAAIAMAEEIARGAPLAVRAIRQTMRHKLAADVRAVLGRELAEQTRLRTTEDFRRGVAASRGETPRFEAN